MGVQVATELLATGSRLACHPRGLRFLDLLLEVCTRPSHEVIFFTVLDDFLESLTIREAEAVFDWLTDKVRLYLPTKDVPLEYRVHP